MFFCGYKYFNESWTYSLRVITYYFTFGYKFVKIVIPVENYRFTNQSISKISHRIAKINFLYYNLNLCFFFLALYVHMSQRPKTHSPSLFVPKTSDIVNIPTYNKGTAFTEKERCDLKLRGLLPPKIETLDTQAKRALSQLRYFLFISITTVC